MARINNPALASVIRTFGAEPNGDVWAAAKAVITPENEADAREVLAQDTTFLTLVEAGAKVREVAKKARPEPEPGTLRHAIRNYEKAEKSATFTKADGTVIACTPKQKAAWEAGRSRFESVNASKGESKVTQSTDTEALAKLLASKPEVLSALTELLSK